jgi:hypothetical protein
MLHKLTWKGLIGIASVGAVAGLIFLAGGQSDIAGVLFVVSGLEIAAGAIALTIAAAVRRATALRITRH